MGETLKESEQAEKEALILEVSSTSDDESTTLNDLSFPWPLIQAIKALNQHFQRKSILNKQLLFSFPFQLLLVFIICILCVFIGSILTHNSDGWEYMLCIIFIVQGVCGVFVVLVHIAAIAFDWTPIKIAHMLPENRRAIWYLITFAHLLTVFYIIWFFIGHIFFVLRFVTCARGQCYGSEVTVLVFTIIMMIVNYIVGIWMIYCRICKDPRILRYLEKKIQHRLKPFPDNDKCLDQGETTEYQKPVDNDANINQPLIHI